MTGNGRDVPTQEKALSVALSVIMVLSVMAIGMAGFAGSAAAADTSTGFAAANPADADSAIDDASHVYVLNLSATGTDFSGSTLGDAGNSDDINVTDVDGGQFDFSGISDNDVSVDIFSANGDHRTSYIANDSSVDVANSTVLAIAIPEDAATTNLNSDDRIRIAVDASGGGNGVSHTSDSSGSKTLNVEIQNKGGSGDQSGNADLDLDLPGPVSVSDTSATDGSTFYSLTSAVTNASSGATVTVDYSSFQGDTIDSFFVQNGSLGTTSVSAIGGQGDIVIQGQNDPRHVSVGENANDRIVELSNNNVTIRDITFDDNGFLNDQADQAIHDTGGLNEITIDGNTFLNTSKATDPVVDLGDGTASSHNITVTGNTLDVGGTDGILVDTDLDTSAGPGEFIDVSNNDITYTGPNTGLSITTAVSGVQATDDETIDGNVINGDGSDGTGIQLDGGYEVNVDDATVDNIETGIDLGSGSQDSINVTSATLTNITGSNPTGINANASIAAGAQITIDDLTVDDSPNANPAISVDSDNQDLTVTASTINNTQNGILISEVSDDAIVSGTSITNTNNHAINVSNPSASNDVSVFINSSTSIDQANTGINVTSKDSGGGAQTVDIDSVTINGTTTGVNITKIPDNSNHAINVTDSTFTSNTNGLNLSNVVAGANNARLNIHLNTFENNDVGVGVNDQTFAGTFSGTFNDFENNNIGLDVSASVAGGGGGVVNANYSYWGAPTGPAGGVNTQDAFGDGDQVSLTNSDDATVYPFLTEETGSLISDSQQSGSQLIVLPDPERPIGNANDDNTALVGVANLNGSVGASNPDLFAPSADSQPTATQSFSGTLSPSNIAQFEVNLSSPDTIDVQGVADGASSNTVQQTYTGQSDSITFSANRSVVSTDVGAEITAQAIDSSGNPVERQGLNVRFAEDSGFSDAGVTLSSSDGNTSNNGTATAIVQNDGSLTPGQEFTVLANIDGNIERANFSTAAGEIDPGASTLRLNGSGSDFGNLQVDSTVDVSAEITDANNNPLEGRTVEFSSNGTVEFGSDSVDTNSDGFANTTATVDTETQGVVAINATAGNFNTTSTSSAQRNITTIAGDATQLGFASDSRSMAPGASLNPTVQVQDEFGNFNDTASVNNGISVTSSDTNVISVSGVDDLNSNSDQFTLSAESGGEATITVSSDDSDISGVNDTFVVSDPAAIDLSVAHNVATVSASNSNANTQNQALVTAQFTDSDGSALGVANENISFGLSGSSAELNQSDVTRKSTDGDGNVTILVNGTDTTGTSTIIATAENFTSINRGETTVTTTGSASGISLSPENDTIAQNDEINVTAEFVDDEGRNVPRLTDVSLSADDGNVTTGTTATAPNDDGAVVSTFTYNSSGANDSVTITATGGGLFGETTVTIEEQEPSVSVNFTDQTVPNGTEEVTIDSANFTRADGSAGDYVVVVHTIDEFGAPVGEVSSPIGASDDLTGAEENINVNLTAADGPINNITEDVTLRAMLHTTADDSAFGTRLGNAINGIEPGDETDDANITVEDEQTVNVGGEDVPVEFTTENDRGERTVTANNAVAAIEAFLNDDPDVDADTAVSVISAFLESN